jgi:WD40 repeat protein
MFLVARRKVWDGGSGRLVYSLQGHLDAVTALATYQELRDFRNRIATGCRDGSIKVKRSCRSW